MKPKNCVLLSKRKANGVCIQLFGIVFGDFHFFFQSIFHNFCFLFVSIHLVISYFLFNSHTYTLHPFPPNACMRIRIHYTTHAYKIKHMHVYLENQGLIHMLEFPFDLNHFLLCVVVVIATRKQSLNYYCQVLCSLSH